MAGLLEQEKWTPYEPTLAGRAKGIWDGLFMSNEAIDLQNQQYKTYLANTQAAPILNNPAQAGGTVLRENATGNLLDMTPEQIATALPLMQKYQGTNQKGPYYDPLRSGQLVGASTDQQAPAYSPQQLGQLGNIPGYADQARQLMVNQARDRLEMINRGVTVNPASLSSMQAEKESRELIDFLDQNSLQNQQKKASIASSYASAAHTRGTEARAESDWASRNYLMENGVLNAGGNLPANSAKTPMGYESYKYNDGTSGLIPIQGTDDWRKAKTELDVLDSALTGTSELTKHYENKGTFEVWDRPAAAQAGVARERAIAGLGVLSNMGVLQPGDYDRLSNQLADPTSINPFTRDSVAIAATKEVERRIKDAQRSKLRQIPTLRKIQQPPE